MHGGKSTGAKTEAGKKAVRDAHKTHGRTHSRAWKRLLADVRGLFACVDAQYPDEGAPPAKQRRIEHEQRAARFLSKKFGVVFPDEPGEED